MGIYRMDAVECAHCKGTGRELASVSLDTGQKTYSVCSICNGSGKVTAEKSHYTQYPDISLQKALQLMQAHGKPVEIHIAKDHDLRVHFKDGSHYVLGGFTVGYKGTGPDYTRQLLDATGFNITANEIAEMKPPITLTVGQPYIAPKTLVFRADTIEEARKAAVASIPPDAKILAFDESSNAAIEKSEETVYGTFETASQITKKHLSKWAEILEEKIEDDTGPVRSTVQGEGDSEEEATEKAKTKLPEGASVTKKEIAQEGKQEATDVEAFYEETARWKIESYPLQHQTPEGIKVTSVECIRQPRSGFMGLGTKPGSYKVHWRLPWKVNLTYRHKKIVFIYRRKPTVQVTYQPLTKSTDTR